MRIRIWPSGCGRRVVGLVIFGTRRKNYRVEIPLGRLFLWVVPRYFVTLTRKGTIMARQSSSDASMTVESARLASRSRKLTSNEVVEKYAGLVNSTGRELARQMQSPIDFDDLVAWGFQGLLEAHSRFNPTAEVTFSSFAYYRIRGAMYDGLRKTGWAMRGTAIQICDSVAINEHLESRAMANAGARRAETFADQIERVSNTIGDCVTICLLHTAELERVSSAIPAEQTQDIQKSELKSALNAAVQRLSDAEREVVVRYHLKEESMASIGKAMGVSTSWVSRINANAIATLRKILYEQDAEWESYMIRP